MVVYGIIHNLWYGSGIYTLIALCICFGFYAFLFYYYWQNKGAKTIVWPFLISSLVFGSYFWIKNGGLGSTVSYGLLVGMITSIVLSKKNHRATATGLFLLVIITLVVAESVFEVPWILDPDLTTLAALPHVYLLSSFAIAFLVYHLKGKFEQERTRLKLQSADLAEKSKVIDKQNQTILGNNQMLEQKVAERTATLELLNRRLTDYAFHNSHEVRGPLCRILGLTILIKDSDQVDYDLIDKLHISAQELDQAVKRINVILANKPGA